MAYLISALRAAYLISAVRAAYLISAVRAAYLISEVRAAYLPLCDAGCLSTPDRPSCGYVRARERHREMETGRGSITEGSFGVWRRTI